MPVGVALAWVEVFEDAALRYYLPALECFHQMVKDCHHCRCSLIDNSIRQVGSLSLSVWTGLGQG